MKMFIVILCVCFLQDYFNALRVTVKGRATLTLITDKPTIRMEDQTNVVRNDSDDNSHDGEDDDGFSRLNLPLLLP